MKLNEVKFKVLFNKTFTELLDVDPMQITWMARTAANFLNTNCWDNNVAHLRRDEDMDCWVHDMLLRPDHKKVIKLEAVPYPIRYLSLWMPDYPETLPELGHPETVEMLYPDHFEEWLHLSNEELKVFKGDNYNV